MGHRCMRQRGDSAGSKTGESPSQQALRRCLPEKTSTEKGTRLRVEPLIYAAGRLCSVSAKGRDPARAENGNLLALRRYRAHCCPLRQD